MSGASSPEGNWHALGPIAELRGPGPFAQHARGHDLVVVRGAGPSAGFRAFEGRCPHQGALLGEGELDAATGQLVCRNHRWRFDRESGQRDGGSQCLRPCPVRERDGQLEVDVTPLSEDGAGAARATRRPRDLPGPRGLPLLGNALQLPLSKLHLVLEQWERKFGAPYTFRLGRQRMVVVTDRDVADQIFRQRPEGLTRLGNVEPIFREMRIEGVFSAEGAAWRPQRRLVMEALSHRHLRGFYPTLKLCGERLVRRWGKAAEAGAEVDLQDDLMRFTIDVTVSLVFGHDVATLEGGDDVIQRKLALIFPRLNKRLFSVVPWWRILRGPGDRRLDRALDDVHAWIGVRVAAARQALAEDPQRAANPSNFLEAMLCARDAEGKPYPDELLYGNALEMLVAGEDTTAHTLAWAVHELCEQPAAVKRLRAELTSVFGDAALPGTMEAASRLDFANAIANEAMRLRPVAPAMFFETAREFMAGDVVCPPGTPVVILSRAMAVDAARFPEPGAFKPERWLDEAQHDPGSHVPFGSGPRICPGRSLALVEMRVVLALLYQNFEVTRIGAREDVREHFAFVMSAKGLRVKLAKRIPTPSAQA